MSHSLFKSKIVSRYSLFLHSPFSLSGIDICVVVYEAKMENLYRVRVNLCGVPGSCRPFDPMPWYHSSNGHNGVVIVTDTGKDIYLATEDGEHCDACKWTVLEMLQAKISLGKVKIKRIFEFISYHSGFLLLCVLWMKFLSRFMLVARSALFHVHCFCFFSLYFSFLPQIFSFLPIHQSFIHFL